MGYYQGILAAERSFDWAIQNNISFLSFYVFSTENWKRTPEQI
jgi:undecaprenyl diphosphate synthase